jgi:hypothetical protein
MKKGRRVVVRYSNRYEKALPNGSFRRRMELHRASHAPSLGPRSTEDPQPPRDPKRYLLRVEKRLPVATTASRLSSMAHRLPLLPSLAYRWHLGEDQSSSPRTPASSLEKEPSAQRGHSRFPVGEDYRGGRRTARLRWRQEGQRPQAPPTRRHRGLRPQGEGPQRKGDGLGWDKDATAASG